MNSIANWKILENLLSNTVIQTGKQVSTLYPHAVMVLHAILISYLDGVISPNWSACLDPLSVHLPHRSQIVLKYKYDFVTA